MEEDAGRARVFAQGADDPETISEAIDCCPVNCASCTTFASAASATSASLAISAAAASAVAIAIATTASVPLLKRRYWIESQSHRTAGISYVDLEDLVTLETEREGFTVNQRQAGMRHGDSYGINRPMDTKAKLGSGSLTCCNNWCAQKDPTAKTLHFKQLSSSRLLSSSLMILTAAWNAV